MSRDMGATGRVACIEACWECHLICLSMATGHCLRLGGAHASPEHLRLMHACADLCQGTADQMIMESPFHRQASALCAAICDACMESCRRVGDMDECVAACKRCKEICVLTSAG